MPTLSANQLRRQVGNPLGQSSLASNDVGLRTGCAAGAVMVAVFLTFALSGPLPPKEMGSSSASRCCSTRCSCG